MEHWVLLMIWVGNLSKTAWKPYRSLKCCRCCEIKEARAWLWTPNECYATELFLVIYVSRVWKPYCCVYSWSNLTLLYSLFSYFIGQFACPRIPKMLMLFYFSGCDLSLPAIFLFNLLYHYLCVQMGLWYCWPLPCQLSGGRVITDNGIRNAWHRDQ